MADKWKTVDARISILNPISPVVDSTKVVLSAVEFADSVLSSVLGVVKAFNIDLDNPLKSFFTLLLAQIRSVLNSIRSSGFSVLVVSPDFSRQDFNSIVKSCSGSYPNFENKVVAKFYDTSDISRPEIPAGSNVAMMVFYLGSDNPQDLFLQLNALLQLIKVPDVVTGLPAPVELKASPILKDGSVVHTVQGLLNRDLDSAISLQWKMPELPNATKLPGFINSLGSVISNYRLPSFIVERSETPLGESIYYNSNTLTVGKNVTRVTDKYNSPRPQTGGLVIEEDGTVYRHFLKKFVVRGSDLLEGDFTGTYRYIDKDPTLERGKTYFYRVRAFFGDEFEYITSVTADKVKSDCIVEDENKAIVRFNKSRKFVLGSPSPTIKGTSPRISQSRDSDFNAYDCMYRAVKAGVMLNFDFKKVETTDDTLKLRQSGFGSLSILAGQTVPLKYAFPDSKKLIGSLGFQTSCRRLVNTSLSKVFESPRLNEELKSLWESGAYKAVTTVESFLNTGSVSFPRITISGSDYDKRVLDYLIVPDSYPDSITKSDDGKFQLPGPIPTQVLEFDTYVDPGDRLALESFIQMAINSSNTEVGHLVWHTVTIGDLFPATVPFLFDIEQYIIAALQSYENAAKNIESILSTLQARIQSLESALRSIEALKQLIDVSLKSSVLFYASNNGSTDSLVQALKQSEDKPFNSELGFHSGIVFVAGGPGEGAVAPLKALGTFFGLSGGV